MPCSSMVVFGGSYVEAKHNFATGLVSVEIFHKSQLSHMDVQGDNRGKREAMRFVSKLAKDLSQEIKRNGGL